MEARMKFGDNPEKFLESEVDLDEEIRKLQAVTATPDLYPELVKLGAIPTLATLLSHENGDIVAAVIELLRDLTDSDAVEELEDEAKVLVEAMVGSNMLELLVHRLGSLDERNAAEDKAVFDTLAVFENMIELDPNVATQVVGRTKAAEVDHGAHQTQGV
ncbi:hypothetical protein WJX84_010114 [Apatococcus fuscideae]|uniref:Beta-catenin-like protein 1 N-terminal domain-containing protein n=1 Tax=Apatococcus fuscideae TaxID=2026836 RepID=A0AAW1RG19_9CHLO